MLPPAFWQLIEQAQDLPPLSRYQIARRCVETTLKMMRPQEIEQALSGDRKAATRLKTKVSNTIMSKILLYLQVETENIKPRVVDLTSEYIEESLDELQIPSNDVATENRLRTIRTPVKAPIPARWPPWTPRRPSLVDRSCRGGPRAPRSSAARRGSPPAASGQTSPRCCGLWWALHRGREGPAKAALQRGLAGQLGRDSSSKWPRRSEVERS